MRRAALLSVLTALLAMLVMAAPASAHGRHQHGHSAAVVAASNDAGAAFVVAVEQQRVPTVRHDGDASCPASDDGCCSNHCCAPAGLKIEPSLASPVYSPARVTARNERAPRDSELEAQFRPPCS